MSHFAQVQLKCLPDLLRATLDAMGLEYQEYPQGKEMRCNPEWKQDIPTAHLIVKPESLKRRSGLDLMPSMDVGFIRDQDGLYSPVLDEYVMRGANYRFGQQFATKYAELAAEAQGYTVVRDEHGDPIARRQEDGSVRLQVRPPARAVVRR